MSSSKKRLLINTVSVSLGCGSKTPKLSFFFRNKLKLRRPKKTTTASSYHRHYNQSSSSSSSSWSSDSVAVEKDSDDPYVDFRQSMLQMILENQIYSKEDLKELLNCFLQLNSPYHHEIIVRAFTEIWNGVLRSQYKSRDF